MSRHLNGWDPSYCFFCKAKFGPNTAKYPKWATMTMWFYICGDCKKRNLGAIRATRGHELEIQDAI